MIPAIDLEIVDSETLDDLIASAKQQDRVKDLDIQKLQADIPTSEDLSRILVVQPGMSLSWSERPKIDELAGQRRIKIGVVIGQIALGGALAVTNLSLGALGVVTSTPGTSFPIPLTLGLVASTYTGFNGLLSAVDELVDSLKPNRRDG